MLLENFTLLYVEDDTDMQSSMKSFLEDEVKEFYQAYDGEEGLALYKDKKPDIILSDIRMAKVDGLSMSKAIKKIDKHQPIVLISAFEDTEILKEAINIGVNNFIVKPIEDIYILIDMLENISIGLQNHLDSVATKEKLAKLTERLELALLGNLDGIWDWNIVDDSIYFSPRWKEIIGYSELKNEVDTWKSRIHPDDFEAAMIGIEKNIDGETDYYEGEHRLKHKDGHWVWILDRGKVLYDEDGKAVRMIGTHTDISREKELQLKNTQQIQIIEQIHDSVITTNFEGIITSCNHGGELLFAYKKEELLGKDISILYLEEDLKSLEKNIEILMKDEKHNAEVRLVKKSKEIIDANLSLSILKDEKGKAVGMVGYFQDITKQKEIQRKLEASRSEVLKQKEIFEKIYNDSKDAIAILDMKSNFLQVNPAYIEMTGMSEEELLQTSCIALASPKDVEQSQKVLKEVIKAGYVKNFEKECITKSGKYIVVNMSISLLHNPDRLLASVRDVTELKNTQKELELLASTDTLTKLYNRRYFMNTSLSVLDLAKRNKTDLSIIMLDIDDFKNVNDTYGHETGDKVLKILSKVLQKLSRKSDIVSRWGGEEFVILLPETDVDGALVISEKIRKEVENLTISSEAKGEFSFTVSLGVSCINANEDSNIEASINRADKALYKAKESGKNRVQVYEI